MEAPNDTNMDIIPEPGTSSSTTTVAPLADAADIFEVQKDSEWQMMGWHVDNVGGVAIYHRRGCTTCSTYAAYLMAAYGKGTVRLMNRQIGEAVETAWPSVICDIDDMVEEH